MERKNKYMNPYLAGVLLGFVLLVTIYITGRGLGASGAMKSVAVTTVKAAAPEHYESTAYYQDYAEDHPDGTMHSWLVFEMLGVVIGFGFALEQAGFSSTRKLVGLFYGYDFTVLKVFFTAGITAMTGVLLLSHLEMLNTSIIYVNPSFWPSAITGGVIMGAGFIIGGFCPGTSACAAAIGKVDGWAFIIGAVIGIFAFGETFPLLEDFYMAEDQGALLIYEVLGVERSTFALIMVAVAILAFAATGMIEDKVNHRPASLIGGEGKNKIIAAAIPIALVLLVIVTPSRKEYTMQKLEARAAAGECKPDLIDPDKLAFELTNNYYKYNVIDVRSPLSRQ